MMHMPTHILLGLWNAKRGVLESENEEQKKQQQTGAGTAVPSMSQMMGQAKSMTPKVPSMPNPASFRLPR